MHSTNRKMRKNPITKKPFVKRKTDSNKRFDTVKTMVYYQRISHTQRFNTRNKQNYIWLLVERIGRRTNSSGNPFSPQRQRKSRNIGAADPRPSTKNKILKYLIQLGKMPTITPGRILKDTGYLPRHTTLHLIGNSYVAT